MVNSIFVYPYARPSGLGTSFKDSVNWKQFLVATLVTLIVAIVLFRVAGLAIMAFAWVVITLIALYLKRQLGGLTGDTYGAINEVTVASVFLMVTLLAYNHWLI